MIEGQRLSDHSGRENQVLCCAVGQSVSDVSYTIMGISGISLKRYNLRDTNVRILSGIPDCMHGIWMDF